MSNHRFIAAFTLLLTGSVCAEDTQWDVIQVFDEKPLEVKLGVLQSGSNPTALGIVLWNDTLTNQLTAVMMPPPYDGTGVDMQSLDSSTTLFALGDICTNGANVVVPFIKDFDLAFARFDGTDWSTGVIPETVTNNFDNADCIVSQAGIVLAGHDLTDSETMLLRSTDGGQNYTFYGRYTNVSGPFDGALREPLSSSFGGRYLMGLNQQPNGQLRATRIDTATNPPSITHRDILRTAAPPGLFQFVKESAARFGWDNFYFTHNADGNARVTKVPIDPPDAFTDRTLFPLPGAGSQFTYFGGGLLPVPGIDGDAEIYTYWSALTQLDEAIAGLAIIDPTYPLAGVGGPVDTCLLTTSSGRQRAVLLGPRVGEDGMDLYMNDVGTAAIFADGFESGDTSAWSYCD